MFAIGLLTIGAIPTTIGVAEAISAQKKQNAAQKEQAKFHLTAKLALGGRQPMEALVVLRDGKVSLFSLSFLPALRCLVDTYRRTRTKKGYWSKPRPNMKGHFHG